MDKPKVITRTVWPDLTASFVVFLVALPLSLGISLASGVPVRSGLVAAIVGGIAVGLLGGAPLQVAGPAAGLTVMVFGFVRHFGFETTCMITILAGLIQLALGLLGVAPLTLIISPAVIHAMLAGIGILITLGQLHVLLGYNPHENALRNITELVPGLLRANPQALMLGCLTLVTLVAWNRFFARRFRAVPASLVAVVAGTFVASVSGAQVPRVALAADLLAIPHLPQISRLVDPGLWGGAIAMALVASAESLLCAVATDKLHPGPRARLNRELVGQGIGNILSGLLAGLPVTGVIVRSSANISAGARTRLSAVLHGAWILLFSVFFAGLIREIPLTVLAALLIHVGLNLVKLHEMKTLARYGELTIYFVTLAGVVFLGLLWGIGIGFGLSLILLLLRLGRPGFSVNEGPNGEIRLTLAGTLTFLSVPRLLESLQSIPKGKRVLLEMRLELLDFAAIDAIRSWRTGYERSGGRVDKESLDKLWSGLKSRKKSAKKMPKRAS